MGSPSWHTIDLDVGFSEVKVVFTTKGEDNLGGSCIFKVYDLYWHYCHHFRLVAGLSMADTVKDLMCPTLFWVSAARNRGWMEGTHTTRDLGLRE